MHPITRQRHDRQLRFFSQLVEEDTWGIVLPRRHEEEYELSVPQGGLEREELATDSRGCTRMKREFVVAEGSLEIPLRSRTVFSSVAIRDNPWQKELLSCSRGNVEGDSLPQKFTKGRVLLVPQGGLEREELVSHPACWPGLAGIAIIPWSLSLLPSRPRCQQVVPASRRDDFVAHSTLFGRFCSTFREMSHKQRGTNNASGFAHAASLTENPTLH